MRTIVFTNRSIPVSVCVCVRIPEYQQIIRTQFLLHFVCVCSDLL